jgi:hypothetical protein
LQLAYTINSNTKQQNNISNTRTPHTS